jgi:hypothetical protein
MRSRGRVRSTLIFCFFFPCSVFFPSSASNSFWHRAADQYGTLQMFHIGIIKKILLADLTGA